MENPRSGTHVDNLVTGERVRATIARIGPARTLLAPLRVGFWRAAVEAIVGWFVLVVAASLMQPGISAVLFLRPSFHNVPAFVAFLGWAWAVLWPVWRLRQAQGRSFWTRLPKGVVRIVLLGIVVGLVCFGVSSIRELWPGDVAAVNGGNRGNAVPGFSVSMVFARVWVDIAAAVRRWARTRLRRQLTVSHMVVIFVTFLTALGVGGFTAGLLIANNLPGPTSQARAIGEMLQAGPTTATINPVRAQVLLQGIASERIRPVSYGGSPLNLLIPWRIVNRRIEIVDTKGKLLAAANVATGTDTCVVANPGQILPGSGRQALITAALSGVTKTAAVPFKSSCARNGVTEIAAAAPVFGAGGRPIAAVLVRGETLAPSWNQIVGVLLVVFTAASFLLLVVTVLPTLGISFLAAMYFARGLTRGLGAVSQAAAALSAGDLSRRVPVTAQNEIGGLAEDFNRMASRLEQIMAELRAARTQAEQVLQSRQELVASVSHELRTPIAIVQAHLEAIHDASVAEHKSDRSIPAATLQALQNEMDRLTNLVEDLFALARAGTDVTQVHCVPIDVGSVVREVAALLGPLAQREGQLTLTVHTAPGLPPAMADGDRLRQILSNLVRNAVRHTPEGGIIALSAREQGPWLLLDVADTGEGIAPDHLPRIFERFYRVDRARSRASGGAGLGLAIVKEFVELMGGHVTVESVVGEGTCFHVFLPRALSAAKAVAVNPPA